MLIQYELCCSKKLRFSLSRTKNFGVQKYYIFLKFW